jgi:CSLREA domain-containing protein
MFFASQKRRQTTKPANQARRARFFQPRMEALEQRDLLALWVVNTLADTVDPDADVTSLREAVQGANASAGADTIHFGVAGTINTTGLSLTDLSGGTLIDGTTAPGYAGAPVVILNGPGTAGASRGLQLTTAGNTVRGLQFEDFHIGIAVTGGQAINNTVAACYLGTDGAAAVPNNYGVVVNVGATNNHIGGSVAQRNLISGNLLAGVFINGAGTSGNFVQNNFIGTDATGTLDLGNGDEGILIRTSAANTRIEVNTIAFNGSDGVRLDNDAGSGHALSLNSVFANGGLGINLVGGSDLPGGVTPNDAGDGDSGPNGLQNYPVLSSAVSSPAGTLVYYSLNSTPSTSFALQFFSSPAADADPSGFGEGRSLAGGVNITTDADGNFSDSILLPAVPLGDVISATASAIAALNTSEFSAAVAVTATRTWDGGGSSNVWSDPLNWEADLAPAAGDLLVFGSGTPTTSVNDFAPGTQFSGLLFTGGDHTISGNQIDPGDAGTTVLAGIVTLDVDYHIDPICPPIVILPGSQLRLSGILSGTGGIHKAGAGTLILAGANTFDGPVHVEDGTLRLEHSLALGSTAGGTELMGGNLELRGGITVAGETLGIVDGTSNIHSVIGTNTWTGTWHLDPICPPIVTEPGSTLRLTGVLSGPGGFHKEGAGTLILSGANTYAGVTHVEAGILNIRHSQALGSASSGTELMDGTLELQGGINIQGESLLVHPYIEQENLIRSVSGVNTWTGNWHLDPICPPIVTEPGSTLRLTGVLSGPGGFHKEGAGTLILSGANTYGGVTHVAEGVLNVRSNLALGSTAGNTEVFTGATLGLRDGITVTGEALVLHATSKLQSGGGSNTWTGTISLLSDPPIVVESGSVLELAGAIDGSELLEKLGGGTLIISGDSPDYTGTLLISAGTVVLDGSLPNASIELAGGTLGGSGAVASVTIHGTAAADVIEISPAASAGSVEAIVNGVSQGIFTPTARIIVLAGGGNDDVQVAGSIAVAAWLQGEAGHDRLKGGAGHDVLLGGEGDDQLLGGQGRDLLIGGSGADRLIGNADEDLLIAGFTDFDANNAALAAIMAEWTSTRPFAIRRANLTNGSGSAKRLNGFYFLNSQTVHDDDDADMLTGGAGADWFFADLSRDKVTDG